MPEKMVLGLDIHNSLEEIIITEIDAIQLVENPLRRLMRQ